jgi:hypothetical protein
VGFPPRRKAQLQKKTLIAAEQDRPDVARRRAQWTKYRGRIDLSRLVFIDETWTKTNMAPLRGWAPLGQRIKAKVPHGRWKTMTFLAALRHDRITAPWFIDEPINGEIFQLYIEKVLIPTLQPGDIVIMDNLGSHKGKAMRRAIRAAGARLFYLPKYSPDLNPNSSSPSSSTGFARLQSAPPTPSSMQSNRSSTPSHPPSAQTTSQTPDMTKRDLIPL